MTCKLCPECDGTTEGSPLDGPLQYCTYCGHDFDEPGTSGKPFGPAGSIANVAVRRGIDPEEIISVIKSMDPFEGDS